jgi:predicted permease
VLLIVCANLANLLLVRSTVRQREFSIRLALGAPRSRLVRQLFTESLMLAAIGASLGLLLARQFSGSLQWLSPMSDAPALTQAPLDLAMLLFTLLLTVGVALFAGAAPAFGAGREDVIKSLKEGGRGGTSGRHSQRLRAVFVTSEMALAVVALIGAGLFVKSFRQIRAIHPGFDPGGLAVAHFNMFDAGYNKDQADSFCRRLREKLEREPGVTSVSYADYVPLGFSGGSWEDLQIQGYVPAASENMKIYRAMIAPGYFDTLRIPLLEGRDFTLQDDRDHDFVMMVNQEFVHRFVRNQYPLGVKVQGWGHWFTIVGVVQDSKIYRLTEAPQPYFYIPVRQIYRPEYGYAFFARTSGRAEDAAVAIVRTAREVDPAAPAFGASAMTAAIGQSLVGEKVAANFLSVLASIAILLAAIGLYSVMAYSVAQRTNEIGIRVTLGARPSDVLRTVMRQGLVFGLCGLVAGSLLAAALARLLSRLLVGVTAVDPATYALSALFIFVIACAATAIPAWRAMRVDPIVALRYE